MLFNKIKFWILLLPLLAILVFLTVLAGGFGAETQDLQGNRDSCVECNIRLNRFVMLLEREVKEYSEIAFLGTVPHSTHLGDAKAETRKAWEELKKSTAHLPAETNISKSVLDNLERNIEKLDKLGERLVDLAARGDVRTAENLFKNELMPLADYSILLDAKSLCESMAGELPQAVGGSGGKVRFPAVLSVFGILLIIVWVVVYMLFVRKTGPPVDRAVSSGSSGAPEGLRREYDALLTAYGKSEEELSAARNTSKKYYEELDEVKESRVKTERELRSLKDELKKLRDANEELFLKASKRSEDPLDAISGFADHIINIINNVGTRDAEDEIQNHIAITQNLLNRINDMVAVSEIDIAKLQVDLAEIGVADIVQNSFETMKPYAQLRGVNIAVEPYDAGLSVRADFVRMRQAMLTMLFNAINAGRAKKISLSAAKNADMLEITVTDSDGWQDNSMICLGFVKKIAELHDGTFEETNLPGKAGILRFSMPFAGVPVPEAPVPVIFVQPQPKFGANAPHILIFGQEPQVVRILEKAVTEEGIRVSTVNSYTKVVKTVRELMPTGIMLDLLKPGEGILQALMDLKEIKSTKDIPVYIVTMCGGNEIIFDLGAVEYIEKPVRKIVLQMLMGRMLGKKDGARVVVVDDSDDDRLLIKKHLAETSHELIECKDGKKAVEEIFRNVPDMIIIDLIMPEHDGFCVIANLRENPATRNLPTIIISNKELEDMDHEILRHKTTVITRKNRLPGQEFIKTVKKTVGALK